MFICDSSCDLAISKSSIFPAIYASLQIVFKCTIDRTECTMYRKFLISLHCGDQTHTQTSIHWLILLKSVANFHYVITKFMFSEFNSIKLIYFNEKEIFSTQLRYNNWKIRNVGAGLGLVARSAQQSDPQRRRPQLVLAVLESIMLGARLKLVMGRKYRIYCGCSPRRCVRTRNLFN